MALIEGDLVLKAALPRAGDRRDELRRPPLLEDPLRGLTLAVELPMPMRLLVRRVEDRPFEKEIGQRWFVELAMLIMPGSERKVPVCIGDNLCPKKWARQEPTEVPLMGKAGLRIRLHPSCGRKVDSSIAQALGLHYTPLLRAAHADVSRSCPL